MDYYYVCYFDGPPLRTASLIDAINLSLKVSGEVSVFDNEENLHFSWTVFGGPHFISEEAKRCQNLRNRNPRNQNPNPRRGTDEGSCCI